MVDLLKNLLKLGKSCEIRLKRFKPFKDSKLLQLTIKEGQE
jgi:hypothetical protein